MRGEVLVTSDISRTRTAIQIKLGMGVNFRK